MAITASDIHNQSFSIDRKGYDVDEVDVFLEHVADEIDGLNDQIAQLEAQLDDSKFDGFDTPARIMDDMDDEPLSAPVSAADAEELAAKDARIAELEAQMERDNARMAEILELLADPDFYVNEDASSDAIAEHAKLKQRLAAAEEEWFTLTEELEAEMARQQERA